MKSTTGEIIVATFAAGIAAVVAALAGLLCGVIICGVMFRDLGFDDVKLVAAATAIFFAVVVFIVIFQKMRVPNDQP
jgi:sugar phosphate permease